MWLKSVSKVKLYLHGPDIDHNRVLFRWDCNPNAECFLKNEFHIIYPEFIDLSRTNRDLLWFIFLASLNQHVAIIAPVEIQLAERVNPAILKFWTKALAIHHSVNVYGKNRSSKFRLKFLNGKKQYNMNSLETNEHIDHCLLFGGGKDALVQIGLFREMFPNAPAIALTIDDYQIFSQWANLKTFAPDYNLLPLRLATDVKQTFRPIGVLLWAIFTLPLLEWFSISRCFWALEFNFNKLVRIRGRRVPQKLQATQLLLTGINRLFQSLNWNFRLISLVTPLTTFGTQRLLVERYPNLLRHQQSCPRGSVETPWCNACAKCLTIALLLISMKLDPAAVGINVQQLFEGEAPLTFVVSPRCLTMGKKLITEIESEVAEYALARIVEDKSMNDTTLLQMFKSRQAANQFVQFVSQNSNIHLYEWINGYQSYTLPLVDADISPSPACKLRDILENHFNEIHGPPNVHYDTRYWERIINLCTV